MNKLLLSTCGLAVTLGGAAVCLHFNQRREETARQLAATRASTDELTHRAEKLNAALAAATEAEAQLRSRLAAAKTKPEQRATPPPTTATTAPKPDPTSLKLMPRAVIGNDPQRSSAYLSAFRESLDVRFGALYKALKFSPEEIERFKDVRVRAEQNIIDIEAAAAAQGLSQRDRAFLAMVKDETERRVKAETEFLNTPERVAAYKEYSQIEPSRQQARGLAGHAVYADAPLTAAQVEQLAAVLAQHSKRSPNGTVIPVTVNWDTALPVVQTFLSPTQIAVLQNLRAASDSMTKIKMAISGQLAPAQPSVSELIRAAGPLPKPPE